MAQANNASFSAIVKGVFSGDTLLLQGKAVSANATAPERQIILTNISAPRFSRSKNTNDEPFAWESREFLRKKCLGKSVSFRVVHKHGDREYGVVSLEGEDVAAAMVSAGWARARVANKADANAGDDAPVVAAAAAAPANERETLAKLEEEAKTAGRGMFAAAAGAKGGKDSHVRSINWSPDARQLFDQYKGKVIPGIVEQVRDGSTFRIELLEQQQHTMIVLHLAGVQCPRVPLPLSVLQAQQAALLADVPDAKVEPIKEEKAGPFAVEAKLFSENRLLHRDVGVRIEGIDKSGNFFGTLEFPMGNITHHLLKNGYGKSVQWSAQLTASPKAIFDNEQLAKAAGLRLWAGSSASAAASSSSSSAAARGPASAAIAEKKDFQARVVQIVSGDCIVVDDGSGVERKIFLSSIRAPRASGSGGAGEQPWGRDAKEFMRKKLIGKRVQVVVEYLRSGADAAGRSSEERVFAAIMQGKANMAEALVAAGLAEVVRHRMDEDRSLQYDVLLDAEAKAKEAAKGIHSAKPPAAFNLIDLSLRPRASAAASAAEKEAVAQQARTISSKCKQYLAFLLREKEQKGTVDFVFNGQRLKVVIPKENCIVSFALSGIRCPQAPRSALGGGAADGPASGEPFGEEALRFTRALCMQHDVTLEFEGLDKGDNFLGSVLLSGAAGAKQQNLAVELLQAGLAQVVPFSADKSLHHADLYKAQEQAKNARIGLWKNYVEPVAAAASESKEDSDAAASADLTGQVIRMNVTDVSSGSHFSAQISGDETAALVDEKMAEFTEFQSQAPLKSFVPKKGAVCAGQYGDDEGWYRVQVDGKSDQGFNVTFMDFGNQAVLVDGQLRALDGSFASLQKIPATALRCTLSGLRTPRPTSEFIADAKTNLENLILDRELVVRVDIAKDFRQEGLMHVSAWDEQGEEPQTPINLLQVRDGWASVLKRPDRRLPADLLEELRANEAVVKKERINIWSYGDVSDDEEDDKKPVAAASAKSAWGARR